MQRVKAASVLSHRPPFLFLEDVTLDDDAHGSAEISPHLWTDVPAWRASTELSALPIEISAQMAGVLLRSRRQGLAGVGYLAAVQHYRVLLPLADAALVEVDLGESVGAFHSFSAQLRTRSGDICTQTAGSIFLSANAALEDVVSAPKEKNALMLRQFQSINATAEISQGCYWLDPALSFYVGHFPGAPVTPGVILLERAVAIACECAKAEQLKVKELIEVTDVMFKKRIPPDTTLDIQVKLKSRAANRREYTVGFFIDGLRALKARIALSVVNNSFDLNGV